MYYPDEFRAGLAKEKLSPRKLDEYDVAALMIHSNIELDQWRGVVQALRHFMGVDRICVNETKWRALGKGAGRVHRGEWLYDPENGNSKKAKTRKVSTGKLRAEKLVYWWKDPVDEVCINACLILNGNNLQPTDIEYAQVVNGGDHGKMKFRFTVKLIMKMRDGRCFEMIYPLADVLCRKDNGVILKNTVLPRIDDGVNAIADGWLNLYMEGNEWKCTMDISTLADPSVVRHTVKPSSFLCGDLAFLAIDFLVVVPRTYVLYIVCLWVRGGRYIHR